MSDDKPASGPWGLRNPADAPRPPKAGRTARLRERLSGVTWLKALPWAACLILCCAGLYGLLRLFPDRASSTEDWRAISLQLGFIALVAGGLASRRLRWRQTLKYVAVWAAVLSVLVLGVAYRSELADVALRLRTAVVPSYAAASGPRELMVGQSADGHYHVTAMVEGAPVEFLVDTGATDIVLSPDDARRIGLNLSELRYDRLYGTANGAGRGAAVKLDRFEIGPIKLRGVEASVNQAPMGNSLLGMSFVRRLQSMRFEGDRLTLVRRE